MGSGLRRRLAQGYGWGDLRRDAIAGLVVGMVALPLSMALAIASGVPPQQGLYTAVVSGVVVALLGGARHQITGPTAAFVALLVPIVHSHGLGGLLVAGFLAGLIQIAMGVGRLGRFIELVPHPVTTGFTSGIAVVIASTQIADAFGLSVVDAPADFVGRLIAYVDARETASSIEWILALGTLGLLIAVPRRSKIPGPLVALTAATVVALLLAKTTNFHVTTVGSRFGGIPGEPPMPAWPWSFGGAGGTTMHPDLALLGELLPAAFAIAILGAIESLLSAVIADATTGDRHDPDAELVALGVGNLLCPIFGGIPTTAALARTATNIRAGAESPLASVIHAGFVLATTILLAPVVAYLPMASMAGLLLFVAYNMSESRHFIHLLRTAPRSDVFVLVVCFVLTILFDMVMAVGVGIVLAALIFMRRMADLTDLQQVPPQVSTVDVPAGVIHYRIEGPLFFGAAQRAFRALSVPPGAIAIILDMAAVPVVDATGLSALESTLRQLERHRCKLILSGVVPGVRKVLERSGVVPRTGKIAFADDVQGAVEIAVRYSERRRGMPGGAATPRPT
ncbi:MAG: C4-dicarboxylic acid transporter DauA [Myxococcales bacterium]|nr:C4-dicarboxylic acid transporter DauA [Myxococcales bacterium]